METLAEKFRKQALLYLRQQLCAQPRNWNLANLSSEQDTVYKKKTNFQWR